MNFVERYCGRNNNGFFLFSILNYMFDEGLFVIRKKCLFVYRGLGRLVYGRVYNLEVMKIKGYIILVDFRLLSIVFCF